MVYGKLSSRFLQSAPASIAHRAVGRTIVVVSVIVATICLSYFELEEAVAHSLFATALFLVLGLKILIVRRWHAASPYLPLVGICLFFLFTATWLTSAGSFLAEG